MMYSRMPCPYAYALGVPGEGVHAKRIGGFSYNDIVMTIIAAILTAYVARISIVLSLVLWFVGGEILHYIFCVQTAFLTRIGVNADCSKSE